MSNFEKATRHVVKKFIPFQNVGREVFDGYTDVNYPPKSATSENSALRVFGVISNIYLGHIVAHTQVSLERNRAYFDFYNT